MEYVKEEMGNEINLIDLFFVLWAKKWIIILSALAGFLLAVFFTQYIMPKEYISTTKVYVLSRQDENTTTYSDLQTGAQLTKDYQNLVTSSPVTQQVVRELNLSIGPNAVANMISVTVPMDTRILNISVTCNDPYLAKEIANAVRVAASSHIRDVMTSQSVNLVEEAAMPMSPSGPNVQRNGLLGLIIGFVLVAGIILVIHMMNDTIKDSEDVEQHLHLGVLGTIPDTTSKTRKKQRA